MTFEKPADFNYPSHYAEVFGSKMHYVETGEGDPILFLHGQPTWSYLWRNVMPEVEAQGRLIALDLIGYGLSDKPDIAYEMTDHIKYVEQFIEQMGLTNITLVIHDWGSFFGFYYAMRNADNVRGIAFMEAILFPVPSYDAFDDQTREFFQALRSSQETAENMMVDQNLFIEGVLPALIEREMSEDEHNAYRAPWADPASRKILCKFPQNLCIGGEPKSINDMQQAYMKWLQDSDTPKLLLWTEPGVLIGKPVAEWCGENLPNCDVVNVGTGLHYIQEDRPREIGQAVAGWMQKI
ncbi:MAG: haloalkane dehalogenase [Woeseiaceae bacterium]|nr:haloalkane dehalogenase [Woeseiaceae bacterium]